MVVYTYNSNNHMLIDSTLSSYLDDNQVTWAPEMPDGVPPEVIQVPKEHPLFRLTKENKLSEDDLITYHELDPNKDWGDKFVNSFGVSLFDDLTKVDKLLKIPSLRKSKGISKLVLNPLDGVVNQTGRKHHYTWWKTTYFDMGAAETVMTL